MREMFEGNLYCFEDMILSEKQVQFMYPDNEFEADYVYFEPYIFELGMNRFLVVQFEGTLAEIMQYGNGMIKSLGTTKDEEFIKAFLETREEKEKKKYENCKSDNEKERVW